jgi:adenylate cyclase
LAIGVGGALLAVIPGGIALEENVGLGWLFQIRGPVEPPPDVVVVGLDRRSAETLGLASRPHQWPRAVHGRLVDSLVRRGALVIVFDMAFEKAQVLEEDAAFAEAIARADRVILAETLERTRHPSVGPAGNLSGWIWLERVRRPHSIFADQALGLAPFPLPKVPARVSQAWIFLRDGENTPTLPAAALQAWDLRTNQGWLRLTNEAGLAVIGRTLLETGYPDAATQVQDLVRSLRPVFDRDPQLSHRILQVLERHRERETTDADRLAAPDLMRALTQMYSGADSRYLNFYGPPGTIRTIPYHQALTAPDDAAAARGDGLDLAGTCVFVGWSDLSGPTKDDGFHTVFSRADGVDLSGVEIAATAFANLLTDRFVRPIDPLTTSAVLFAFGVMMALLAFALPALIAVPSALALAGGYGVAAQLLFNSGAVWLPLAIPLLIQLPLALLCGLFSQYVWARRQRWRVQQAMGYYVPKSLVREFADHPVDPIAVRETVYATCLATDAENFTSLAEGMTPEATAAYLNAYFDALAAPLRRHQTDKDFIEFHADGVMCAWISTQSDAEVRERACLAALETIEAIDAFNARHAPLVLGVRVGLHAGRVFIGNVGGGGRFGFRLVGDIANTASRLEGLNKHVGTRLLASAVVTDGIETLLIRPLGEFCFKGRRTATPVVEILTTKDRASMAQMSLYGRFVRALELYRAQRPAEAADCFAAILEDYPDDGPSRFYLDYCRSRVDAPVAEDEAMVIRLNVK